MNSFYNRRRLRKVAHCLAAVALASLLGLSTNAVAKPKWNMTCEDSNSHTHLWHLKNLKTAARRHAAKKFSNKGRICVSFRKTDFECGVSYLPKMVSSRFMGDPHVIFSDKYGETIGKKETSLRFLAKNRGYTDKKDSHQYVCADYAPIVPGRANVCPPTTKPWDWVKVGEPWSKWIKAGTWAKSREGMKGGGAICVRFKRYRP